MKENWFPVTCFAFRVIARYLTWHGSKTEVHEKYALLKKVSLFKKKA